MEKELKVKLFTTGIGLWYLEMRWNIDTVIKDGWGTLLLNQINGRLQFDLMFLHNQYCTYQTF